MTRRQAIVNAFIERLEQIDVANGHSCTPLVLDWHHLPLQTGELPAVVLKDGNDTIDASSSGAYEHHLEILIEATPGSISGAETLRALMQDIMDVIADDDETTSFLEHRVLKKIEMLPPTVEQPHFKALLRFELRYYTTDFAL